MRTVVREVSRVSCLRREGSLVGQFHSLFHSNKLNYGYFPSHVRINSQGGSMVLSALTISYQDCAFLQFSDAKSFPIQACSSLAPGRRHVYPPISERQGSIWEEVLVKVGKVSAS
jgi:hypothetical protein